MAWGDAGVTEQVLIPEDTLYIPSTAGGVATRTLQRAGLIRRLRMRAFATIAASSYTAAPNQSGYGPLGGMLRRIRLAANGQIPLFDMSGLGATIYNEVANRDGSPQMAAETTTNPATIGRDIIYGRTRTKTRLGY